MKNKTNLETLNELINPETFAFERGSDYGKGSPLKTGEISTKKITDTLVKMIASPPTSTNSGLGSFVGAYLGEEEETDGCENKQKISNVDKLNLLVKEKTTTLAESTLTGIDLLRELLKN